MYREIGNTNLHGDSFLSISNKFLYICIPKNASRSVLGAIEGSKVLGRRLKDTGGADQDYIRQESHNIFKFSVIRDPFCRALSFWADKVCNFIGTDAQINLFSRFPGLYPYMPLDAFLEWLNSPAGSDDGADPHILSQHFFLLAPNGELCVDRLICMEDMETDWPDVSDRIHLPGLRLPQLNSTRSDDRQRPLCVHTLVAGLADYQRVLLRQRYARDCTLYEEQTRRRPGDVRQPSVKASPALTLISPKPFQVFQRRGQEAGKGFSGVRTAEAAGWATVHFAFTCPHSHRPTRVDLSLYRGDGGSSVPFFADSLADKVSWNTHQTCWTFTSRLPAGGWYVGEIIVCHGDQVRRIEVGPFGVGEVFVIAGQSYAGNTCDMFAQLPDRKASVSVYDAAADGWRIAYDPLPMVPPPVGGGLDAAAQTRHYLRQGRNFQGGSIWPLVMGLLSSALGLPVGFVVTAHFSVCIAEIKPISRLFPALAAAGRAVGDHRAVLWQHGESDARAGTSAVTYGQILRDIRAAYGLATGQEVPWLLAKSTYHPPLGQFPAGQREIRAAIDTLVSQTGFAIGPDKDLLGDLCFAGAGTSLHLNDVGQQALAALWFTRLVEWTTI